MQAEVWLSFNTARLLAHSQDALLRLDYIDLQEHQSRQAMEYQLLTEWKLAAPQQLVYDTVLDSLEWPSWWPGLEQVDELVAGDADGIGGLRRYVWKGRLPYRLSFVARTTRVETPCLLAAIVEGDLAGSGRWTFSHEEGVTNVRYEWQVRTTKPWMNALAPFARSIFASNHHDIMRSGGEGLARRLGAQLIEAYYGEMPAPHAP
jgi:hypothetical protein